MYLADIPNKNVKLKTELNRNPLQNYFMMQNYIYNAIKPIYYLSRFFFVWPYKYTKAGKISELSLKDRMAGLALALAFNVHIVWSLNERQLMSSQIRTLLFTATDVVFVIFQHLLAIPTMIISNSGRCDLAQNFYSKLGRVDQFGLLSRTEIFLNMDRKVKWDVIVKVGLCVVINLLDIISYMWEEGCDTVKLYISGNLTQLIEIVIILQIDLEIDLLRRYFGNVNKKLETSAAFALSHGKPCASIISNRLLHFECEPRYVKRLFKIHRKLCDLVDVINDNHGWKFIMLGGHVVSSTLGSLYYCFGIATGQEVVETSFAVLAIIRDTSNIIYLWVILLGLLKNCSSAKKEAFRTGIIASDALLDMETENYTNTESLKSYKKHLEFVTQRISFRNPHFSAAGIFDIDLTTVSTVAAAVTSYFIVFLQFKDFIPLYSKTNGSRFD